MMTTGGGDGGGVTITTIGGGLGGGIMITTVEEGEVVVLQ